MTKRIMAEAWRRRAEEAESEVAPYLAVFPDGSQVAVHASSDALAQTIVRFRHPAAAYIATPSHGVLPNE